MRTIAVVGASGRLGGFVVTELLLRGHQVIAIGRSPGSYRVSMMSATRLHEVRASASSAADLARVRDEAVAEGFVPDGLVVCVGGWWSGELLGLAPGEWDELAASHLTAHFLALRQFAPDLTAADDGACVMSGGIGTERIVPGSGAISVFGAAQRALLHAVRQEAEGRFRCQEVAIMGPLAQDERNEPGDPAVPGEVAATAIADTLEGRHGDAGVVHVGPDGPLPPRS